MPLNSPKSIMWTVTGFINSVGSDLAAEYTKVSLSHTKVTMETATSCITHIFTKFKSDLPTLL